MRIDVAAAQTTCGKIPDAVMSMNLHFHESAVKSCWCETFWLKEVFSEAKNARTRRTSSS